MQPHAWFTHLFEWTAWANARIAEAISPIYNADAYMQRQFSHIVHAQERWLQRLQQTPPTGTDLFAPLALEEALQRDMHFSQALHTYMQAAAGQDPQWLDKPVPHSTGTGQQYVLPVSGVLTQLLHHGTHHRAQLAARLALLGHSSPPIDYIFYARR
jgi:uncharacterized damage-inducible protein DinB